MKRIILIALSTIGMALSIQGGTASPIPGQFIQPKIKISSYTESTCQYGQCQATAKSTGNRCKHCVSNSGDKYCYQHK